MECGGLVCPEPRRPPLLRPQSLLRVFLPSGWPTEPAHKTIPALPNSETTAAPTQRVPPREPGSCETPPRSPCQAPFRPAAPSEWRTPPARYTGSTPNHRHDAPQEKFPPASAWPPPARVCVYAAPETHCSQNPYPRLPSALPAANRRRDISNPAAAHTAADRKSTRLNSSYQIISYAVFC